MSEEFTYAVRGTALRHVQISYGPHPDHVAEVLTGEEPPSALVILVHGGFWRSTYDRGHTAAQCVALARTGYAVAAVEYRRVGGDGGWPNTFHDIAAGVDGVPRLLQESLGALPVVLVGHSAGGHLVLWAASRHRTPPGAPGHRPDPSPLAGVVALGAVADLGWSDRSGTGGGAARDLLGTGPDDDPEGRWAAADPACLLPTGIPTVLIHGALDDAVPIQCAYSYGDAAKAAGDPCTVRTLPGVGHFEFLDPTSRAWSETAAALDRLLA